MIFGRGKRSTSKSDSVTEESVAEETEAAETEPTEANSSAEGSTAARRTDPLDAVYERELHGPFDIDEVDAPEGYVDLGALLIAPQSGLQLRLEVEESSQRVIAVTLDLAGSSLQLQAFAAPRSSGLWSEIRENIAASVESQGGNVEELDGSFGPEVLAKLPAEAADGSKGFRAARFIGVDGPRWFLRGVLGGPAALEADAASELEALFRTIVVVRGDAPMPPRDLLPLALPKEAAPAPDAADQPQSEQGLEPPKRGPEITQIG
ncbi:DUF3710 domain-containing protein [Psychromicrobium sp. YIM B11713]|uniref:DUF3710 domain-containing protein n=1 Tax=Psychromicrobium sp. YIM B11713 TaxID=3145233 RepID=UPI00374FD096